MHHEKTTVQVVSYIQQLLAQIKNLKSQDLDLMIPILKELLELHEELLNRSENPPSTWKK